MYEQAPPLFRPQKEVVRQFGAMEVELELDLETLPNENQENSTYQISLVQVRDLSEERYSETHVASQHGSEVSDKRALFYSREMQQGRM
jgi:hypothetical protein